RYVAPARSEDMSLAPRLRRQSRPKPAPTDWRPRAQTTMLESPDDEGRWFLGPKGVRVDRSICGTGAGVRLAIVDDDTADANRLDLDALVPVGVSELSAASGHGALMVGWAVGTKSDGQGGFRGTAPDASVRLYCIPKAGTNVFSFPLAVVRAVRDGADVIVCATYLEATTSPMLDDALDVAVREGRRGRGTVVLLPTGRETSSPAASLHASLSLALGDPASDPRVHCVAPSGRAGGWFLWRDARGKLRPFANRGPAVRWLAPGDDLQYPLAGGRRMFHAESSGASAVAAGVIALVLGRNPHLRLRELQTLLRQTATTPDPLPSAPHSLADPSDVLPAGRDPDGHDAKCGYGRLDARRACAAAQDPFALALVAIGEDAAACAWLASAERPYSRRFASWAARTLLRRSDLDHSVRVLARHARLVANHPLRAQAHAPGALTRQLGLVLRELSSVRPVPLAVSAEIDQLVRSLHRVSGGSAATLEREVLGRLATLWPVSVPLSAVAVARSTE
ncbi:MAG TPA: S8/S53 family peptidase, partial [Polyangiaceae bacterium]